MSSVMYYSHPSTSEEIRKKYASLSDLLRRISYKPGWNIELRENPTIHGFDVVVVYDGYESKNAAVIPVAVEDSQVTRGREVLSRSCGKTVRQPEKRYFRRHFDFMIFENLPMEQIIKYIIGDTIKHAELFEFDRWFKFEGTPVFENRSDCDESYSPRLYK